MNADEQRKETGRLGEQMIDALLRQKGLVPYYPAAEGPHPFDRLVASKDKRKICIVEVKTKWRREAYKDTGINRRHYDDYQHITRKYRVPLFLAFVDGKEGKIYGNWWSELLKPREPDVDAFAGGCQQYPWEQRGIVYFPLSAMRVLAVIPEDEKARLARLRASNWRESA